MQQSFQQAARLLLAAHPEEASAKFPELADADGGS